MPSLKPHLGPALEFQLHHWIRRNHRVDEDILRPGLARLEFPVIAQDQVGEEDFGLVDGEEAAGASVDAVTEGEVILACCYGLE